MAFKGLEKNVSSSAKYVRGYVDKNVIKAVTLDIGFCCIYFQKN